MNILVVVNNHLANIFKYAYFIENFRKLKNANFYFLIDEDIYNNKKGKDKFYINKFINKFPNVKQITNININQNYNKILIKDLYNCFANFRKNKNIIKNNYNKINKILLIDFKEVWISNSNLLDYLNSNTLIRKFEHGIGDIHAEIKKKNFLVKLKQTIERFLNQKLFLIKKKNTIFYTLHSFKMIDNSKEIRNLNAKFLFRSLKTLSIKKKINKNNIIILYPFDFVKEKKVIEDFAYLCFQIIINKIKKFQNKTIYIKGRNNVNDIKIFSKKLRKLINKKIQILDPNNYINIEYYLLNFKPKFIISTFNLGIYFFKYILNKKFNYININSDFENILLKNCQNERDAMESLKNWRIHLNEISRFDIKYKT
jgi:hypothetical protein